MIPELEALIRKGKLQHIPKQDRKQFRVKRVYYLSNKFSLQLLTNLCTLSPSHPHSQIATILLKYHHNYLARLIFPEFRNYRDHCRKTDRYFPYTTTFTYLKN